MRNHQVIVGYRVAKQVYVALRDRARADALPDAGTAAGSKTHDTVDQPIDIGPISRKPDIAKRN